MPSELYTTYKELIDAAEHAIAMQKEVRARLAVDPFIFLSDPLAKRFRASVDRLKAANEAVDRLE